MARDRGNSGKMALRYEEVKHNWVYKLTFELQRTMLIFFSITVIQLCDSLRRYLKCKYDYMVFIIYTSFPDSSCVKPHLKRDFMHISFFLLIPGKAALRVFHRTAALSWEVPSPGLDSHYLCSHKQNTQHMGGDFTHRKSAKRECGSEADAVYCAKTQVSSKRKYGVVQWIYR